AHAEDVERGRTTLGARRTASVPGRPGRVFVAVRSLARAFPLELRAEARVAIGAAPARLVAGDTGEGRLSGLVGVREPIDLERPELHLKAGRFEIRNAAGVAGDAPREPGSSRDIDTLARPDGFLGTAELDGRARRCRGGRRAR